MVHANHRAHRRPLSRVPCKGRIVHRFFEKTVDSAGNFYVTGLSLHSLAGPLDFATVRYDSNGNLWATSISILQWLLPQLLCHASQRPIHFLIVGVSRVRL
jgi:hypothetical protein